MTLAAACIAASNVGARTNDTYNDTIRTKAWSIYIGGAVSGTSNYRGMDAPTHRSLQPEAFAGVKYYINPMWRLGLNIGWNKNSQYCGNIATYSTETPNFTIGDRTATLTTTAARMQYDNAGNNYFADLNVDFNIMDLWHNRKAQKLNIWAGVGVGYMYSDVDNAQMWAYDENAIAQGDSYFNVYSHSYVKTHTYGHNTNNLYVPATLSIEYDLSPCVTVGVRGQYKWLPLDHDFTPYGMWSAGVTLAYNFGGKKALKNRVREVVREVPVEKIIEKVVEKEVVKEVPVANKMAVFFKINQSTISDESMVNIRFLADMMKANKKLKYTIQGYADQQTGNTKGNQTLSEKRAQAVYDALVNEGVSPSQLKAEPKGEVDDLFGKNNLSRVSIIELDK